MYSCFGIDCRVDHYILLKVLFYWHVIIFLCLVIVSDLRGLCLIEAQPLPLAVDHCLLMFDFFLSFTFALCILEKKQSGYFFTAQPFPLCLWWVSFILCLLKKLFLGKVYFAISRTAFSFKFFCSCLLLLCHLFRSALIVFFVFLYLQEVLSCAGL